MPILAHKIRLTPTPEQVVYFRKACGTARFTYNWALAEWQRQYKAGETPSMFGLKKQFNAVKRQAFPWITEVTKCATDSGIMNLGKAFSNFFQKRSKYPRFHKKGVHDSITLANDKIALRPFAVQIPKLGWVKMTESLRFSGHIKSAVVSRIADHWFVSLTVEMADSPRPPCKSHATVGVDVGIETLATLSNGIRFENPKATVKLQRRLARLNRAFGKKRKGSQNREKANMALARLHYRIACIRKDATHKLTDYLAKHFRTIVIEDLNVHGMMKNRKLAKHLADANFFEIHRQATYKAALSGGNVERVNRFYPSSKTCSQCGHIHTGLKLSDRVFACPACGHTQRRDENAAVNLMNSVRRASPEFTLVD